ncbi:unnamed protein product [Peniophora sp. CBMAI 1063]|nr:unnamed protein product [Peniophora sp. CBMAI 1063]
MRANHDVLFLAREVSERETGLDAGVVVASGGAQQAQSVIHEAPRVGTRGAKIDELDLASAFVPEEVRLVRVGLLGAEAEELEEAKLDDPGGDLSAARVRLVRMMGWIRRSYVIFVLLG